MKKILTLIFYFILLFFFFDIKEVNTIDDIALIYDNDSLYDQKYYNISFYDFYLNELNYSIKDLDIQIISITLKEYGEMEFTNICDIIEKIKNDLTKNGKEEMAINIYENNFEIESMVVISTKKDMLELENRIRII